MLLLQLQQEQQLVVTHSNRMKGKYSSQCNAKSELAAAAAGVTASWAVTKLAEAPAKATVGTTATAPAGPTVGVVMATLAAAAE